MTMNAQKVILPPHMNPEEAEKLLQKKIEGEGWNVTYFYHDGVEGCQVFQLKKVVKGKEVIKWGRVKYSNPQEATIVG